MQPDPGAGKPVDGPSVDADPPPGSEEEERPDIDRAAAMALGRAKAAAAARGLRPGSRPGPQGGLTGRARASRRSATYSGAGSDARDPRLLGDSVESITAERGWDVDVAVGTLMGRWPAIVGPDVSAHAIPVTFQDGVLTIRADSTAWATQLRLVSSSLLARLTEAAGEGTVTELRIKGPSAPAWSRGLRKAPGGRGPRDTYG